MKRIKKNRAIWGSLEQQSPADPPVTTAEGATLGKTSRKAVHLSPARLINLQHCEQMKWLMAVSWVGQKSQDDIIFLPVFSGSFSDEHRLCEWLVFVFASAQTPHSVSVPQRQKLSPYQPLAAWFGGPTERSECIRADGAPLVTYPLLFSAAFKDYWWLLHNGLPRISSQSQGVNSTSPSLPLWQHLKL